MKSIAIFNNKGGVGKTTLTFHLACALAEKGYKTLLLDLDPQSNLTLFGSTEEALDNIWSEEENFIDDFDRARTGFEKGDFDKFTKATRSVHYILKPTEDGTGEIETLPLPIKLDNKLGLIPGRLTLHMYEDKIATLWSQAFLGNPLAIRTITRIRKLCLDYSTKYKYDFVLIDTSPSLGILNKVIISMSDAFFIPCLPDMFSLYGIRNIGNSLRRWKQEFETMYNLISDSKRNYFPTKFVQFIGFTIFNAKRYFNNNNEWGLAQAHYNYAKRIPNTIEKFLPSEVLNKLPNDKIYEPIGKMAVMHSHATLPNLAQKYKKPIWKIPDCNLENEDKGTVLPNHQRYRDTQNGYSSFADDILDRINFLG